MDESQSDQKPSQEGQENSSNPTLTRRQTRFAVQIEENNKEEVQFHIYQDLYEAGQVSKSKLDRALKGDTGVKQKKKSKKKSYCSKNFKKKQAELERMNASYLPFIVEDLSKHREIWKTKITQSYPLDESIQNVEVYEFCPKTFSISVPVNQPNLLYPALLNDFNAFDESPLDIKWAFDHFSREKFDAVHNKEYKNDATQTKQVRIHGFQILKKEPAADRLQRMRVEIPNFISDTEIYLHHACNSPHGIVTGANNLAELILLMNSEIQGDYDSTLETLLSEFSDNNEVFYKLFQLKFIPRIDLTFLYHDPKNYISINSLGCLLEGFLQQAMKSSLLFKHSNTSLPLSKPCFEIQDLQQYSNIETDVQNKKFQHFEFRLKELESQFEVANDSEPYKSCIELISDAHHKLFYLLESYNLQKWDAFLQVLQRNPKPVNKISIDQDLLHSNFFHALPFQRINNLYEWLQLQKNLSQLMPNKWLEESWQWNQTHPEIFEKIGLMQKSSQELQQLELQSTWIHKLTTQYAKLLKEISDLIQSKQKMLEQHFLNLENRINIFFKNKL